eukprot:7720680-Alexandrium_andersonii.AAC.1
MEMVTAMANARNGQRATCNRTRHETHGRRMQHGPMMRGGGGACVQEACRGCDSCWASRSNGNHAACAAG